MKVSDDLRSEKERFQLLDYTVNNIPDLLYYFDVQEKVVRKKREDIVIVGRNDDCLCGSGKKFKKCCGKNLCYEHTHFTITLKEKLNFIEITV